MGKNDHTYRNKIKVETSAKERDQQLLEFIAIDILKLEQQHPLSQEIITLPINPIIYISFNKTSMSWELIRHRLLHPTYSVTKAMYYHRNLDGPPFPPKNI